MTPQLFCSNVLIVSSAQNKVSELLQALQHEPGTSITSAGALATLSGVIATPYHTGSSAEHSSESRNACIAGAKTGRSPRDKRVVREPESEDDIWWNQDKNGSPNFEMDGR